jgi:hypothetical protein
MILMTASSNQKHPALSLKSIFHSLVITPFFVGNAIIHRNGGGNMLGFHKSGVFKT